MKQPVYKSDSQHWLSKLFDSFRKALHAVPFALLQAPETRTQLYLAQASICTCADVIDRKGHNLIAHYAG